MYYSLGCGTFFYRIRLVFTLRFHSESYMGWIYLFIAGLFEIGWAVGMKYSVGFTKLLPSVLTAAGMIFTYIFLSLAIRTLPLGPAYAIWTGIGIVGSTILGRILFGEMLNLPQMLCIAVIIAGIIGLKMLASPK